MQIEANAGSLFALTCTRGAMAGRPPSGLHVSSLTWQQIPGPDRLLNVRAGGAAK
ncbi:hypothetical protein NicSoilB4_26660 [Arthrobacter sp. NicSoilB4]|uniref:hypothetical protein n=1 Tax=Arthrobacter sp. NicSoilB4 TaxID=2830997 RepID=UPI001CC5A763|nr:hypothetical protein [Arthrobacter sp. NicSoilB4]BCW67903.1 hypothetical protein NicSoilB4_26660 [Arthrobacter sp. NicSoilB4]